MEMHYTGTRCVGGCVQGFASRCGSHYEHGVHVSVAVADVVAGAPGPNNDAQTQYGVRCVGGETAVQEAASAGGGAHWIRSQQVHCCQSCCASENYCALSVMRSHESPLLHDHLVREVRCCCAVDHRYC